MSWLIRLIDRCLRRVYGVYEYWDDPRCLFRIRLAKAPDVIHLPEGTIPTGVQLLELHFWNEHMPPIPEEGPDLAWGLRSYRMTLASLRRLAGQLRADPRLKGVQAITGVTVLYLNKGAGAAPEQLFQRLGFTLRPHRSRLGSFGEFWENLYTWLLMKTYNAVSLRRRRLLQLQRHEVWMPISEFVLRYGGKLGDLDRQG